MRVISVGRGPQNDVVISDSRVSRRHLLLKKDDNGKYSVVDLQSKTGTFVNGKPVIGECPIIPGDQLRIGQTILPWESYFKKDDGAAVVVGAGIGRWSVWMIVLGGIIGTIVSILFLLNAIGENNRKHAQVIVEQLEIYGYDEYINDSLTRSVLVQDLLDSINQLHNPGTDVSLIGDDNGNLKPVDSDDDDEIILAAPIFIEEDPEEEDVVFMVVESMPEFPGGQQALFEFLSENVKYPVIAQENGIQGRTVCQFTIERDGSVTDVEVVKSSGDESLDKESVRVIKSMPLWKPGKQRGKPVRVKFTIPINYRLQ